MAVLTMTNERLRRAMLMKGLDPAGLAERAGASTKSVERWISGKTVPYPKVRFKVASILGEDESYLWTTAKRDYDALAQAEVVAMYASRSDVPRDMWVDLLRRAQRQVDVLVYAGMFLCEEHPEWIPLLAEKMRTGVRVRLLLGDRSGTQVAARDAEYNIGGGVGGRISAVLAHYRRLSGKKGLEMRLHDTPLYNSIYRFDDDMIVNVHAYGLLAFHTPTLQLRRLEGRIFDTYAESFERCWFAARPYDNKGRQ